MEYGEIIELGSHRLMCGDATKRDDVERLIDGESVDLVFTDPPYGMRGKAQHADGRVGGPGTAPFEAMKARGSIGGACKPEKELPQLRNYHKIQAIPPNNR